MEKDKYKVYKYDTDKQKWLSKGKITVPKGKKMENTILTHYKKLPPPNWDRIIAVIALIVAGISIAIDLTGLFFPAKS